jgi:hypothetical protein
MDHVPFVYAILVIDSRKTEVSAIEMSRSVLEDVPTQAYEGLGYSCSLKFYRTIHLINNDYETKVSKRGSVSVIRTDFCCWQYKVPKLRQRELLISYDCGLDYAIV